MKVLAFVVFLGLAVSCAMAGEIYGTVVDTGKPLPAGIKVEITSAGKTYSGETDKFGTYHIFVNDRGKCHLTVHYKDQKPAADIFSYDRATRYDWTVESAEGKLSLKRK